MPTIMRSDIELYPCKAFTDNLLRMKSTPSLCTPSGLPYPTNLNLFTETSSVFNRWECANTVIWQLNRSVSHTIICNWLSSYAVLNFHVPILRIHLRDNKWLCVVLLAIEACCWLVVIEFPWFFLSTFVLELALNQFFPVLIGSDLPGLQVFAWIKVCDGFHTFSLNSVFPVRQLIFKDADQQDSKTLAEYSCSHIGWP